MKILYVMDSLGTGGAERSTADLWYFLRSKNDEIRIVVLEHRREGIEQEIVSAGFDVHFLRMHGFVAQALEIRRQISSFRPDLVHAILFRASMRTRLARCFTRFKLVESLVNCTYDPIRLRDPRINRLVFYINKLVDRISARMVDRFVAVTQVVKDHYVGELHIAQEKISVIHRGRNENPFIAARDAVRAKFREELHVSPDTVIVIHVGRQEFQKGHEVLLKAIGSMQVGPGTPAVFVFLGREGNATPGIKHLLATRPVQNVRWLGHRHDVPALLAASDVFVFPSYYEGMGGALVEAQAAGLPVICSDIAVFREVVDVGVNAFLVEPANEVALAEQIARLIGDNVLRESMGRKSIGHFRKHYTLEQINARMRTFYTEIS